MRVLNDPPLAGPANMARDEALMTRVGRLESPPTVRLYQWDAPTISLGYFQRFADYESLPPPAGALPVVRRLTGGGAILHDQELTYSLVLPAKHALVSDGPNRLYELAHDAVIACLAALGVDVRRCGITDDSTPTRGPFFCFERRHCYDVLAGQEKIAGSAQRRTREAILQHGSVVLGNRFSQQATALCPIPFEASVRQIRSDFVEHLTEISGQCVQTGEWTSAELAAAEQLEPKYAGDEWTRRR